MVAMIVLRLGGRRIMHKFILVIATALISSAASAIACGTAENPCSVELGSYVVAKPDGPGPYPAVVFLHGYGAGGYVALSIGEPILARGYAVIGPQGLDDSIGLARWNVPTGKNDGRNEPAFLRQVIESATNEHNIDPTRIILSGHSNGGTMTSYVACDDPGFARAYAPLSGTFRRPHPTLEACSGPVNLLHTHGWTDDDVPIEGQSLWGGEIIQGDVFYALQVWRTTNGCERMKPDATEIGEKFWRRSWKNCAGGTLELALHPGGHKIPEGWPGIMIDWFEALP